MVKRKPISRKAPWVRCSFCLVVEEATPEQVSERLSLPRDEGRILNDEVVRDQLSYDGDFACSWVINSGQDSKAPVSYHITDIVERLESRREQLRQLLAAGALAEIKVAILSGEFAVPLRISSALMMRVAQLNVELVVYFTPEGTWDKMIAHVHS